ncbi:ABC transporter ATP-binding protein [Nonomuraea lactucae]|uniref:ABC transporter ATP-binding protein n=1 Tax=Nonomuraea lactucae TaxID=2249762 RepID=UPI0019629A49|nr:ABC transporter ATP-binding protein [Nonomuraea lactucae]
MTEDILSATGLVRRFAGVTAVDDVDLSVRTGEILGLIGPNGAGKTTLVNLVTGFDRPDTGRVFLDGHDITRLSAAQRSRRGLVRTFQGARIFGRLTVRENLVVSALPRLGSRRRAESRADELLEYGEVTALRMTPGERLSAGTQRIVGLLRAVAAQPSALLIDEPAAGLNEVESDQLSRLLSAISENMEIGMMIIEHDMKVIMSLCHRVQVLNHGRTIAVGSPDEIRRDPAVLTAYLGSSSGNAHA